MLAIDTETTLATNDEPTPRLVSVAVAGAFGHRLWHRSELHWSDMLEIIDGGEGLPLAFANAPFDVFVLCRAFPELRTSFIRRYECGEIWDVATREKMIDIAEGMHFQRGTYDLGSVAWRRAGVKIDKADPWRKHYVALENVPIAQWPEAAKQYAIADAVATYQTAVAQEGYHLPHAPDVARKHLSLYAQTLRGIETDPEAVAALDRRLTAEIEAAMRATIDVGLARWQGKKRPKFVANTKAAMAQMVRWCHDKGLQIPETDKGLVWNERAQVGLGKAPPWAFGVQEFDEPAETKWHEPTGVQLSEDSIRDAGIPDDHPLATYRQLKSLRARWTKNIPVFRRSVIRTRYDECKDTARTGSSAPQGKTKPHKVPPSDWIGSNLQNLPQEEGYRECLRARPGHVLVVSDWGQAELVSLSQHQLDVLGVSPLARAMIGGLDPHAAFAASILGCAYDPANPEHKAMRKIAKFWNFGKWGGMGDPRFQILLGRASEKIKADDPALAERLRTMRLGQIREYTQVWKAQWDAKRYFDWVSTQPSQPKFLPDGPTLTLYTMVHPRSGFVKGGCSYTEACNFPFQHGTAAAAATALWWLLRASWEPGSPLAGEPTSQILHVHDECVAEVPCNRADGALELQEQIMIAAFRQWCPDVPIKVESKIMERYSK